MADQYLGGSQYFDESAGGQSGGAIPRNPTNGPAPGGDFFFNDPIQRYYESAIRKRVGQLQEPLDYKLPGMDDFKGLMSQFGGGYSSAIGGAGAAPPSSLDAFRKFAEGFSSNIGSDFNSYMNAQDPQGNVDPLRNYAGGRNPTGVSDQFRKDIEALGPNTSIDDLKAYMEGRNLNEAPQTIKDFLAAHAGDLSGYESNMANRVTDLRGNPFDDTYLQARRVAAFEDIERERQVELGKLSENLAARGISPSSGLMDRAAREVNQRYDQRRAEQQNNLVQEEFQLRESRNTQADALENQGATFRLQAQQIAGGLTSQIAQLQQQGVAMTDALQQTIATLGLQSRQMEQQVATTVATLTNQGYQLQDALQIALTQAGLQAQQQADALRVSGADIGLKEQAQGNELQQILAQLGVTERGQNVSLQQSLMNALSQGQSSSMGSLMDYLRLQMQQGQYEDVRQDKSVTYAGLLDAMARGSLDDLGAGLPTLPGGAGA